MQLEYAKNPAWSNADHTAIDLKIKWVGINEEFPFTAMPTDVELHGRQIFENAVAGAYGDVAPYVPQQVFVDEPTPATGSIPVTSA